MKAAKKARQKNQIREANEQRILKAAVDVFARYGYRGATTGRIAEEAGIPKANLHYYFPTKEILYRKVLDDIFRAWMDAADTFEVYEDPVEALTRYIETKMELSRKRPKESKIWATEIIRGAPVIQQELETTLASWLETRAARIDEWSDAGKIQPLNPRFLMYMIWAVTQHFADFEHQIKTLNRNKDLSEEQFAEAKRQTIRIILKGIGAEI